ncbi:MAG: hypothetical protein KatS3mg051_1703 [Anaerolineae bacterium]|nr:MAG: hypothetical protein KatS3mg051_1703 [Anaerolineae bacterium]
MGRFIQPVNELAFSPLLASPFYRKAPMAVYWKAVAAWAYHISRAIN